MKEYKIKSLRDIFELPTDEMVERCLKELAAVMIASRNLTKAVEYTARDLAKKDGIELPAEAKLFLWPDETVWRDDNGGTSDISLGFPDNKALTMKLKHAGKK